MKMNKESTIRRLIAGLTVLLLIIANFLPILSNISFAVENPEENVEINGYFSSESVENTNSLVCDVGDGTLTINFEVIVKNGGYFKSGVIKFGENLNFKLNPDEKYMIKENQLKLPEVNTGSKLEISIPISFNEKDECELGDLQNNNEIIIKGEYIDDEGKLYVIEKILNFDLTWKQETKTKIDMSIIKNIDFEKEDSKGKIMQLELTVSGEEENKLPIKSTAISLDIPKNDGLEVENVTVDVDRLSYTQGREDYATDFADTNYYYDNDELVIQINNTNVLGKYCKSYGEDKYIITFVYTGESEENENKVSNVKVNVTSFTDEIEEIEYELYYNMQENAGDVVQYYREHVNDTLSTGYLMANSKKEIYNIDYIKKDILNISRSDLISGLEVVDLDEYFIDESGENVYYTENENARMSVYRKTEFSRENLLNVLGEEGWVRVVDISGNEIAKVVLSDEANVFGLYELEYTEPISKIKFQFSDPLNDGNISIVSTKTIKKLDYSRDEVKTFNSLVSSTQGYATYNEGDVADLGIVTNGLELTPIAADATLEIEQNNFDTSSVNEAVNFKIKLNNNDDTSDLYEDPVFELNLPEQITDINVKNIDLFYTNGELELSNIESFVSGANQVIRISLKGQQSSYDINKETNGTVISIDADIYVNELTQNEQGEVRLNYYNRTSVNYVEQADWNMNYYLEESDSLVNGTTGYTVYFNAPGGLINIATTELVESTNLEGNITQVDGVENSDRILSVKQEPDASLLEPGVAAKLATMYINIVNNTDKSFSDFKILGRLPFIGNKDILTGEDLGTTVDTILDSGIKGENLPFTVYYSENPDATADLYDENNNWKTEFYKVGGIRSYLILLNDEYVLEPNSQMNFEYDYVIPANLSEGDAFYGMFVTYFKEGLTGILGTETSEKTGYEVVNIDDFKADMKFSSESIKQKSDVELEILLTNNSENDIRNLNIVLEKPVHFDVKGVTNGYWDGIIEDSLKIDVDKVEANSKLSVIVSMQATYSIVKEKTISGVISAENLSEDLAITSNVYAITEIANNAFKIRPEDGSRGSIQIADVYTKKYLSGERISESIHIGNYTSKSYDEIKLTKKFEYPVQICDMTDAQNAEYENEDISYVIDKANNTITWTVKNLEKNNYKLLGYNFIIDYNLNYGIENTTKATTTVLVEEKNYEYERKINYRQAKVTVTKELASTVGFVSEGSNVDYVYYVTNEGNFEVKNIKINCDPSEEVEIKKIETDIQGKKQIQRLSDGRGLFLLTIPANTTVKIVVTAEIGKMTERNYVTLDVLVSKENMFNVVTENYSLKDGDSESGYQLTGNVFATKSSNLETNGLLGVVVDLYDAATNEHVASTISDVAGRYIFSGLEPDTYYIKFNYDDSAYQVKMISTDVINENKSDVIKVNQNYITDNITINDSSLSDIDLNLTNDDIFDMKIDIAVENMTVQNVAESTKFVSESVKLSKVDIDPKLVSGSKVMIEYKVIVENQGTIPGRVNKIVDYLPEDVEFNSSMNPDWYIETDGNIYTRKLKDEVINPGETREISLILMKNMTDTNTGIVHNTVEIVSASNDKGILDIDSIPGNALAEDDMSYADSIIGVKTGTRMNKLPIIFTLMLVIIPVSVLVWRKLDQRRYV